MAAEQEVASLFAKLGVYVDRKGFADGRQALDGLTNAATGAEKSTSRASGSMRGLAASAGRAAAGGLKLLAAGLAGAAVAAFALVQRTASAGASIDDMAKRTGASARDLQRLSFSAKQSGTDIGTVESSLRKMANAISDASNESSPAAKAFARLGVDVEALGKLGAEERLGVMADALGRVSNDADRTALAMDILGKGGTQLFGMFEGGSETMRELGDQAHVMSDEQIANAAALDDMFAKLENQLGGIAAEIGSAIMPAISDIANGISDWVKENDQFIRQDLPAVMATVGETLGWLITTIAEGVSEFRQLTREVGFAWEKVTEFAAGLRDDLQPAIEVVTGIVDAWATAFTTVNTAIGDGIAAVLDYIGVLDTLKAAWNSLPFMGESIDELTERLHGGVSTERKAAAFANPDNEARRQGKIITDQIAVAQMQEANARTLADAQRLRDSGRSRSRRPPPSMRASKRGGGGGGARRRREDDDEADEDALDDLRKYGFEASGRKSTKKGENTLLDELEKDFGGKSASPREMAGGGASAVAGASFVRIDASYNAPTTVHVNLPRGSLGRTDEERGAAIGDATGRALEKRNREAAEHYHEAVRP